MPSALANYCEHLQRSFAALYAALEVPRIARRVLVVLLVIHTGLLAYSAYVHSPTLNEPGHLVAGLSYWKFGRFDVYNVNPPLVKMVAALPVMAAGYNEDWSGFYEGPGARPETSMGEDFVAANGERSFYLFMIARWACIPFSWLGAIVCYLWARDLNSRPAGLLAASIWCVEPNILAHASLMTPDAHATGLGLAACYTFWRWLRQPTWTQAALTGVVLGLAELAKTTLILFYPLWPLMWLVYRWPDRYRKVASDWIREAGMLGLRMLIGLYVLNLGYGFEGSFTRLNEYHFVSDLFTGKEPGAGSQELGIRQSSTSTSFTNRFAGTWLGELPVPFPKHFLLGIDVQQRDFEHYGRPSYLKGVWRDHGWWYYYLYASAIKIPLGLWALGVFTLFAWLLPCPLEEGRDEGATDSHCFPGEGRGEGRFRDYFILLFPAVVIFAVVSSKTGFNEHMRYVLPAFPFFYIAIASHLLKWLTAEQRGVHWPPLGQLRGLNRVPLFSAALVGIFACWFIASSLWIYPHSLSYFNESIGGPRNGPMHLVSSNVDWGQDLLYIRSWKQSVAPNQEVGLAYHGGFDPGVSGLVEFVPLIRVAGSSERDSTGRPSALIRYDIVSFNLLKGYPWFGYDGRQGRRSYGGGLAAAYDKCMPSYPNCYSMRLYSF